VNQRARSQTDGSSSSRPDHSSTDVSRETLSAPEEGRQLFGEHVAAVERYAELLATAGVERGLLGPGEVGRLWQRHLLNCGVVAPLVPAGSDVCDVGSGAGLPGVVLALFRPDLRVTLLDSQLRRASFLNEVTSILGLANVEVVRARAEDHPGRYDVVTSRAVAPLGRLAEMVAHLCRPGGVVLAIKGQRAETELKAAARRLPALGFARSSIERLGEGIVSPPTTVVRLVKASGRKRSG